MTIRTLALMAIGCYTAVAAATKSSVSDWPRVYTKSGNKLQIFPPQLDSWPDGVKLKARFAALVTPNGTAKPAVGVLSVEAKTETNHATRTVTIKDVRVVQANFGSEDPKYGEKVRKVAEELFPKDKIVTSLDRLLTMLDNDPPQTAALPFKTDPPTIFVRKAKARMLLFDGEPAFAPVEGPTGLFFAVNTNWPVFRAGSIYYLLNEDLWLSAKELKGPWSATGTLPAEFSKMPATENWKDVKAQIPPKPGSSVRAAPEIVYTDKPAELIQINGSPAYQMIPGTNLAWITNTESDLFWVDATKSYYYLVAGRWYRTVSLDGPWVYCTPDLPTDFAKIPADHAKGRVLASVPGTAEAREAVFEAQVPQLATVTRNEITAPTVSYSGEPQFKKIDDTSMEYALNTTSTVIRIGSAYYLCEKAVWFSAPTPSGPWVLLDKVPTEIYTIPPSSPVHNVTYVKVYESSPASVTYGYTAGFIGGFVVGATVVWGTGYYYPPYFYYGPHPYPIYHPYPYTYGCGAFYSVHHGGYYRGGYAYGPYGGAGWAAGYNPHTGRYERRTGGYGPGGAYRTYQAYNPHTGVHSAGYQASNPYQSWGRGVATNGDDWVRGGYYSDSRGSMGGFQTSQGGAGIRVSGDAGTGGAYRTSSGDIYAGRDGSAYKRQDGSWHKYENGQWTPHTPAQSATTSTPQTQTQARSDLNRDYQYRQSGTQRSQSYQNWRSSGANPRTYSGGGRAIGGRRR